MSFLIELNEASAARRAVPFRLFNSNGTSPDTNASDGTILWSVNGGAQRSAISISAISVNAGMYFAQLSQSNVSVLGSIALYTDTLATDFPQHVANVQVVNNNPMSTLSALSDVTIKSGTYSAVSVRIETGSYSGLTVGAGNFAPGVYSGVSFSVRDSGIATSSFQAGNYSGVSVEIKTKGIATNSITSDTYSHVTWQGVQRVDSSVTPANAVYSGVTVRIEGVVYSGLTIKGIENYANISNVTLHAGSHSDVTIQGVTRVNSSVTPANAAYSAVTVRIEGVSYSGLTIDGVRMLATPAERSIASSLLSTTLGGTTPRLVQQAFEVLRNKVLISGSTMTVYQADDATSSWTATVSTGTATIYGIDPGLA